MLLQLGSRRGRQSQPEPSNQMSQLLQNLVAGSGQAFADRGSQTLKGVPGDWQIYAVEHLKERHVSRDRIAMSTVAFVHPSIADMMLKRRERRSGPTTEVALACERYVDIGEGDCAMYQEWLCLATSRLSLVA